jgi:hypothetical protein
MSSDGDTRPGSNRKEGGARDVGEAGEHPEQKSATPVRQGNKARGKAASDKSGRTDAGDARRNAR